MDNGTLSNKIRKAIDKNIPEIQEFISAGRNDLGTEHFTIRVDNEVFVIYVMHESQCH
jgi:hypothetical protein